MRDLFFPLLMGLALLLAACSGSGNAPSFTLSLESTTLAVAQGDSGTFQITTTAQNGFTGTVALSLEGAPAGVSLSPTSVQVTGTAPATHTLTIAVDGTVESGDYPITLKGASGAITKLADFTLKVLPAGSHTLSGAILSEGAGAPVQGASLRLYFQGTLLRTATSDGEGRFTFDRLPEGGYRLEVQKSGMAGSVVEGIPVPAMSSVTVIQKPAFDASATTTPPTLKITQNGTNSLEGQTFTNTIPFRVQVDTSKDYVKPMRYIYVALGRTPGSAFLSQTATSSRSFFASTEDTGSQTLAGSQVAGLGDTDGERVYLEVVAYDFNNNRSHYILPITFINTASTQTSTVSAPTQVAATAITLTQAVGFYSVKAPLSLTVPLGKGQIGEMPLAAPEGSNLYVEVRWCYTASAVPFAFDIERSQDGQNWTRVGTVGGARSASCPTSAFNRPFFFRDASSDLTPGQTYYYRVVARGANRAESTPSSTTPLPPFFAPLQAPADEIKNVSKKPNFVIGHPQLNLGADGAAYNLVLWDTLTGDNVTWQTLGGGLLLVEFGTGDEGNGIPQGEALVYGLPGGNLAVYTDTAGLLDSSRPNVVPVDVFQGTVTLPYNFDGYASLPELQALRTYAWQLYVSYAYKYNPDEGYRISAYSVQTWPSSTSFIRLSRPGTQVFEFTTGE
ncbi:carboxypeptidase-like regulatory domain-containing protein [Meiothermus ruber]|uniref:Carboxypeptidase regulatory-like domain-containing protein n=1 Tax=Meiothermus ruber (strain ATCC 35948 / DSM 1279 / VKM B-1258 / 21) TaxID=504728 RepID=D3PQ13_MEIRD|nr:carboxypeptidase-like regulatory domain-containing protein [Meiothermus ruber]ADD27639.1 hypothetical protein Mrub_0874 [Meiothermus ruber DSM 1279]AGK04104.1 hypothetical protein K649_04010 [Meiothermus ruber DSM 1279]